MLSDILYLIKDVTEFSIRKLMWEDGANHSLFIDKGKLTQEYLTIFEN